MSNEIDFTKTTIKVGSEFVGVGAHCKEPGLLPDDLRNFVEDPESKG